MFPALKNIYRLLSIVQTLARNDLLWLLKDVGVPNGVIKTARIIVKPKTKGRPGERIASALQELGPTFIKFGQALSTRTDLLGEKLAKDLSKLQDNLSPFDKTEVRNIIEQELGIKIEECFSEFTWEPVAAASIAQVHFAVTQEGEEVAVKVLRPNIERAFTKDIALFLWIATLLEHSRPEIRRLKPIEVVETRFLHLRSSLARFNRKEEALAASHRGRLGDGCRNGFPDSVQLGRRNLNRPGPRIAEIMEKSSRVCRTGGVFGARPIGNHR